MENLLCKDGAAHLNTPSTVKSFRFLLKRTPTGGQQLSLFERGEKGKLCPSLPRD